MHARSLIRETSHLSGRGSGTSPGVLSGILGSWMSAPNRSPACCGRQLPRSLRSSDRRRGGQPEVARDLDVAALWSGEPPAPWDVSLPPGVDLIFLNDTLAGTAPLEGQVLFEVDEVARVRWVALSRRIWLDERPRFERSHAEFLEAIRGR